MHKIIFTFSLFILTFGIFSAKAEKRKILFIGNSYIYVNDLPNTLKSLALSLGDSIDFDMNAIGSATLQTHCTNATTLAKIQAGGWDYVVVQAQSQEPSFDPAQVATDTYPYAKTLDSLIHVSNPCAETVFYLTWGRKNGDASNCGVYPPVCTYAGMQQRLRESYLEMSMNNHCTCAPVGVAWKRVRDNYPLIELYNADESHPVATGTYLAACTFYSSIYHKSTIGASYVLSGVTASDAITLQTIASHTVLDSLENWQQHGSLPFAKFSKSNTQNQFTFTNQSLRSLIYEWSFGDATPISNVVNPVHTYAATGNYIVTMKAKNACDMYDIFTDTVHVTSVVNATNDIQTNALKVVYSHGKLTLINNDNTELIEIRNINGELLLKEKLVDDTVNVLYFAKGVYFYSIYAKGKLIAKGKFGIY